MKLFDDEAEEEHLWKVRESGLGATARIPGEPDAWEGWEDSAVRPHKLGDYLRDLRKLLEKYGYNGALYGHFGQGCIHTRIDFDLKTREGVEHFRKFLDEAADLVGRYGGSISGEHGDGQSQGGAAAEDVRRRAGPGLPRVQGDLGPESKMNPHGSSTRAAWREPAAGAELPPAPGRDAFPVPRRPRQLRLCDRALRRRRRVPQGGGGDDVPELHGDQGGDALDPRPRAPALRDAPGRPDEGGWKAEPVREALDLCLACKGCKGECPVNVDMATYKAEFLSHYYEGRLRPRHAYAMGWIYWWARLASWMPGVVNALTQAPGLGKLLQVAGRHLHRAARCRRSPTRRSRTGGGAGRRGTSGMPPVMLWADTFNNHFHPQTLKAAVEVLEDAGFQVMVPEPSLCCGRPLYDFGMLDTAKRLLRQILDTLRPEIEAGIPFVGLEPSCVAVFRDELHDLFPMDEDAKRLRGNFLTLSEFLEKKATGYRVPKLRRKAMVHGHCHHKHVMTLDRRASGAQEAWASTSSCSTRAAAAWPARSASRPSTTTSRSPSASACCCPPCARRRRTR